MSTRRELQEIADNMIRERNSNALVFQTKKETKTITPYGEVWSKLYTINHIRPLRKGEILAQWIRNKRTGKKEKFLWLGVVEKSENTGLSYKIYYRSFVDQHEKEDARMRQLMLNQQK